MKKKILIIIGALVVIVVLLILLLNKTTYVIKVHMVDDKSPDRILEVYNNKNEKVEIKRIELLNGKYLCDGINTSVYYGNIENIEELRIVLKDNSKAVAKVIKEEVK